MTATKQQQQLAKATSWLAQLKAYARWAGFDLPHIEQSAKERYNRLLDELTVEEAQTLAWEYADIGSRKAEAERAARTPINGPRSHPCIQCKGDVPCHRSDCRETAAEHRYCHEGFRASEWVNYHRRIGRTF